MPRAVQLQNSDGTPLAAFDFGTVLPGTTSAIKDVQLRNTGDVAVSLTVWVQNNAPLNGTLSVSFGGVGVLGVSEQTADDLGSLPPGAALAGQVQYAVPAISEGAAQVQSYLKFQYS